MKRYSPHLVLIRDAIIAIEEYRPRTKAAFLASKMTQDAILMRLQVIGENLAQIRQIDEEAFDLYGQDSWIKLIGLRNIISHGYHTVKRELVWQMITQELTELLSSLERLED